MGWNKKTIGRIRRSSGGPSCLLLIEQHLLSMRINAAMLDLLFLSFLCTIPSVDTHGFPLDDASITIYYQYQFLPGVSMNYHGPPPPKKMQPTATTSPIWSYHNSHSPNQPKVGKLHHLNPLEAITLFQSTSFSCSCTRVSCHVETVAVHKSRCTCKIQCFQNYLELIILASYHEKLNEHSMCQPGLLAQTSKSR